MSTLAFKVGTLVLRQISKPVASRVKGEG